MARPYGYRFEVTAVARHQGAIPVRLRYWSVREALSVERAYHNMGFETHIGPITPRPPTRDAA